MAEWRHFMQLWWMEWDFLLIFVASGFISNSSLPSNTRINAEKKWNPFSYRIEWAAIDWTHSLCLSLSLSHIDYCAASHSFNDKVMWIEKNSIPNAIQSPYNEEPRKRWSEQERSEKKIMWKTWICEQPTDLMRIKRLTYASLPFSLFVFLACELRFFIL